MTAKLDEARPLIANYGGGVDSTAMLVEMWRRRIVPDVVIFADVGSEKPETYEYIEMFSRWLSARGLPEVTVVRRNKSRPSKTGPGYDTIEGNCLQNRTLPSLAFGRKSCSLKWKADPMDKWHRSWQPAIDKWASGGKPTKCLGYDSGPADSRRAVGRTEDDLFIYRYPLREWGWTREDCVEQIVRAGLPVPVKSACFFCPASKPWELLWLATEHPDLFKRAIVIEDRAQPNLDTVEGLWRSSTKKRSGSWRKWGEQNGIISRRKWANGGASGRKRRRTVEIIMPKRKLREMARKDMPATAGTAQGGCPLDAQVRLHPL